MQPLAIRFDGFFAFRIPVPDFDAFPQRFSVLLSGLSVQLLRQQLPL